MPEISFSQKYLIPISVGFLAFFALVQIVTVSQNPLPWFDETVFASVSYSLNTTNTFDSYIFDSGVSTYPSGYAYGPVYFYLQSFLMQLLGFGAFSSRILNLLASFSILLPCYALSKMMGFNIKQILLGLVLVSLDIVNLQNSHSGRMEFLVILLFLSACAIWYKNYISNTYSIISALIIGLILSTMYLTTPRCFFLLIAFAIALLYSWYLKPGNRAAIFIYIMIIAIALILPVACWIYGAFGSLDNYLSFYKQISSEYVGIFKFPHSYHYPLFALLGIAIISTFKSYYQNPFWVLAILAILLYKLAIMETGPYFPLVSPFVYLVIIYAYNTNGNIYVLKMYKAILGLTAAVFIMLFLVKVVFWFSRPRYNVENFKTFIGKNTEPNSIVLADYPFYYDVINSQRRFIYINASDAYVKSAMQKRNFNCKVYTFQNRNLESRHNDSGQSGKPFTINSGDNFILTILHKFNINSVQSLNGEYIIRQVEL